jgi:hypothetical protein
LRGRSSRVIIHTALYSIRIALQLPMSRRCCKGVPRAYKGVTRVLRGCYKSVTRVLLPLPMGKRLLSACSRSSRAESREQRAESREQRAESREQRSRLSPLLINRGLLSACSRSTLSNHSRVLQGFYQGCYKVVTRVSQRCYKSTCCKGVVTTADE